MSGTFDTKQAAIHGAMASVSWDDDVPDVALEELWPVYEALLPLFRLATASPAEMMKESDDAKLLVLSLLLAREVRRRRQQIAAALPAAAPPTETKGSA